MMQVNVPQATSAFIGRERDLDELCALLADSACRLLTLVGPGGTGKTRLAQAVASCEAARFDDGMHFIPLQPLNDVSQLVAAMIETLDLQVPGDRDAWSYLLDTIRDKHMLVILDNFEHLLAGAELVSELLAHSLYFKVIVTSREALNLRDEWVRHVTGLDYPDNAHEIDEQAGAVQLFARSVHRMRGDFVLADEYAAVVRICQLVQGMPLALELAASWARVLSCQDIADEIERSIDFLATSLRDVPERHRSMRSVLDHTWQQLDPAEQAIFRKLAVFRGGFLRDAAAQVADAQLLQLASLTDKSLLTLDSTGRYQLHELLRQYAEEQLQASTEQDETYHRYCQYYAQFLADSTEGIKGKQQLASVRTIAADWNNIRTAWRRAIEQDDVQVVDVMMEGMLLFCDMQSRHQEGIALFQQVVDGLDAHDNPHFWLRLYLFRMTVMMLREWTLVTQQPEIERCLQQAEADGLQRERALSYWLLGMNARNRGDLEGSVPFFETSIAAYEELEDRFYVARVTRYLSYSLSLIGPEHRARARQVNRELVELSQDIGDQHDYIHARFYEADFSWDEGNFTDALHDLDIVAGGSDESHDPMGVSAAYALSSHITFCTGDFDKARDLAEQALRANQDIKFPPAEGLSLATLGYIASVELEDYVEGQRLSVEGYSWMDYDHGAWPYDVCRALAVAALGLEDYAAARRHLHTAAEYHNFETTNLVDRLAVVALASVLMAEGGDYRKAVEWLALALTHPASVTGWMEQWGLLSRLRAKMETQLGTEAYSAAWEQGAQSDLTLIFPHVAEFLSMTPRTGTDAADQPLADPLSERELEVLALLANGMSNQEIARQLVLAVGTVKAHNANIYSKLAVRNRIRAVQRAQELGLLGS